MAVLFRGRGGDRNLAEQVKRIKSEYLAAKAAGDATACARLRDEAWKIQEELLPLVRERRDGKLASLLSDLARTILPWEMEAGNWDRATRAGNALATAVSTILHAMSGKGFIGTRLALLKLLLVETPAFAEATAYVAHCAGHPVGALGPLETFTGIAVELRTSTTVMPHIERNWAADPAAESDMEKAIALQQATRRAVLQNRFAWSARDRDEEAIVAVLALPERPDPVEQYFMTSPNAHAVRAVRLTERTVVYVLAGYKTREGVAIRVNRDRAGRNLVESVLLPGLTTALLKTRTNAVENAFRQHAQGPLAPEDLEQLLLEYLAWTGATVWDDVLAAWPDLASQALAVIPIGRAALLPLYTATVGGEPACARMNLTMAPSARALHYAAIHRVTDTQVRPLVAADHWGGDGYLPHADDEARAIAAIYGTKPDLCETDTEKAMGGHRSLRILGSFAGFPAPGLTARSAEISAKMREATVVHLSCHGVLNDGNIAPALLLGGIMQLTQILQAGENQRSGNGGNLRGHPLVVLSACELGGFLDMGMPGEQAGFPAGFIAIGARAVVGSLWLVPDGRPTKRLMEDFHRRLADLPSNAAVSATIAQAHRTGVPRVVWGSLTHYGV